MTAVSGFASNLPSAPTKTVFGCAVMVGRSWVVATEPTNRRNTSAAVVFMNSLPRLFDLFLCRVPGAHCLSFGGRVPVCVEVVWADANRESVGSLVSSVRLSGLHGRGRPCHMASAGGGPGGFPAWCLFAIAGGGR